MSVGLVVTKSEVDQRTGDITRAFQRAFDDVGTMKGFLDATPDADLVTLGYTPEEVASLKTAWSDLTQLASIWVGAADLPAPKDFREFVRRLWGVGAF